MALGLGFPRLTHLRFRALGPDSRSFLVSRLTSLPANSVRIDSPFWFMGNPVAKDSLGAKIIAEEERLFGQVQARVAMGEEDDRPQIGASDLDEDLLSLRDQIAEARPEDLPPLIEQMTRLAALKARLGGGKSLPVDITSPYFAHIRLRESGKTKDVLVGKRGFIDRQSNVQIVDWRNAPVSRICYRYEEGDDYEEEIAGRRVEGMVEARRNVSIARGNLR